MKIAVHAIGEKAPVVRDAKPSEEAAIIAGYAASQRETPRLDIEARLAAIEERLTKLEG